MDTAPAPATGHDTRFQLVRLIASQTTARPVRKRVHLSALPSHATSNGYCKLYHANGAIPTPGTLIGSCPLREHIRNCVVLRMQARYLLRDTHLRMADQTAPQTCKFVLQMSYNISCSRNGGANLRCDEGTGFLRHQLRTQTGDHGGQNVAVCVTRVLHHLRRFRLR